MYRPKGTYNRILLLARPFYKKGRELEEEHHLTVAEIMENLLKEVSLDREVMIPAALLHDIGYSQISLPDKNKTHYINRVSKQQEKIIRAHMKLGAELAERILEKCKYDTKKIRRICQIISTHDNHALGLPISSNEGRLLKEADILWMATEKAFWLDVKRRPGITPKQWLNVLRFRFTKDKNYTPYLKTNFSKSIVEGFLKKDEPKAELNIAYRKTTN